MQENERSRVAFTFTTNIMPIKQPKDIYASQSTWESFSYWGATHAVVAAETMQPQKSVRSDFSGITTYQDMTIENKLGLQDHQLPMVTKAARDRAWTTHGSIQNVWGYSLQNDAEMISSDFSSAFHRFTLELEIPTILKPEQRSQLEFLARHGKTRVNSCSSYCWFSPHSPADCPCS